MKTITTENELKTILNNNYSIILAKTRGCSVCNAIKPQLQNLKTKYPNINFYEIYIEDFPSFRGQHLIFTAPTVLIMENNKELHRESRFINLRKIENFITNLIR